MKPTALLQQLAEQAPAGRWLAAELTPATAWGLASQLHLPQSSRPRSALSTGGQELRLHQDVVIPCRLAQNQLNQRSHRALLPTDRRGTLHPLIVGHERGPGLSWGQKRGFRDGGGKEQSSSPDVSALPAEEASSRAEVSAERCDAALQSYAQARERYKTIAHPKSLLTPKRRLAMIYDGAAGIVMGTRSFLVAIPRHISAAAAMTREEWVSTLKGWWKHLKVELHHYWVGSKLLVTDVRVASKYVWKVLNGEELSRREKRQLTRTSADLFRLVPFLFFVLVPFMEVLLPVALRLFPNMLPSTFETQLQREEAVKKRLAMKLELARFLQDTVAEAAKDIKARRSGEVSESARDFYKLVQRVRAGVPVSNAEIIRFARLFNDELTLDNVERINLVAMCQFLGITPFGTDAFLRTRLRTRLAQIKADDRMIQLEGVDSLKEDELREACRQRGIRAPRGQEYVPVLQQRLEQWLDLSLNQSLPSSLLIMSAMFAVTADVSRPPFATMDEVAPAPEAADEGIRKLRDTLSALPDEVVEEVEMETVAESRKSLEKRLEHIRREEELIAEEAKESKEELLTAELKLEALEERQASTARMAAQAAASAVVREAVAGAVAEHFDSQGPVGESEEERAMRVASEKQRKMKGVLSALAAMASASGVVQERKVFLELVQNEVDGLNAKLAEKGTSALHFTCKGLAAKRPIQDMEVELHEKLSDRVSRILHRIEAELDAADKQIGERLHLLDQDSDGFISREELQVALSFLQEELGSDDLRALLEKVFHNSQGPISVAEMMALVEEEQEKLKQPALDASSGGTARVSIAVDPPHLSQDHFESAGTKLEGSGSAITNGGDLS